MVKGHDGTIDLDAGAGRVLRKEELVLDSFRVVAATGRQSRAAVTISRAGHGTFEAEAAGEGAVDGLFRAVDQAIGTKGRLLRLCMGTAGEDVSGDVRLSVEFEGQEYSGRGLSRDVLEAAARAYVRSVDDYLAKRKRHIPHDTTV